MHIKSCLATGVLLAAALPAHADWTGKGNIGASFATGNSEDQSASAALELKQVVGKWTNTVGFAGNYGSGSIENPVTGKSSNETTAQRWEVRGQTQYEITKKAYAFGAARYEDDRFSAYDYQASLAGGLGYKFIDTDKTKFWAQGGVGYRTSELIDTGETVDGVIFRGDVGWDYQVTKTTKLVDRFLVEAGSDNTFLQNDFGLEVTISGALGLRVGYQVRHNTDVPAGTKKTDTLSTVGLLYETK